MKRLGISMFALFVGVPMMANAAVQSPSDVTLDSPAHVAGTSYVQGAYNAMAAVARDHATQIDANTSAIAGKQAQLTDGSNNVSATVKTTVGTTGNTDNSLVTETAVRTAIEAAKTAATYDDSVLSGKVSALETAVGDSNSGLVADVNALETTVGNASSGLVKRVTDLEGAGYITKSVNDLTNYTTTTDMNTALAGKQDKIEAGSELDADLVDDSTSTNKFVTASEKSQITTNANNIGTIANLGTTATNLVGAINEVKGNVDTLGAKQVSVYTTWGQTTTAKVAALVDPDPVTPGQ